MGGIFTRHRTKTNETRNTIYPDPTQKNGDKKKETITIFTFVYYICSNIQVSHICAHGVYISMLIWYSRACVSCRAGFLCWPNGSLWQSESEFRTFYWRQCDLINHHVISAQGLVTIQVNILSMYKHIQFLTKTTAAPSQEVVEGRSWYFLKRITSWELNQTGFWIY